MNFLADEGVESEIVETLRAQGHDVLYVLEMSPGISDSEVLDLANLASSILITSDKDFGELVFRQQRIHQGVILVRLQRQSSRTKAAQRRSRTSVTNCRIRFQSSRAVRSAFVSGSEKRQG